MRRSSRRRIALVLRVRILSGDAVKPERNIWIPLPLLFLLAFALDMFACVSVHVASIVLLTFGEEKMGSGTSKTAIVSKSHNANFFSDTIELRSAALWECA